MCSIFYSALGAHSPPRLPLLRLLRPTLIPSKTAEFGTKSVFLCKASSARPTWPPSSRIANFPPRTANQTLAGASHRKPWDDVSSIAPVRGIIKHQTAIGWDCNAEGQVRLRDLLRASLILILSFSKRLQDFTDPWTNGLFDADTLKDFNCQPAQAMSPLEMHSSCQSPSSVLADDWDLRLRIKATFSFKRTREVHRSVKFKNAATKHQLNGWVWSKCRRQSNDGADKTNKGVVKRRNFAWVKTVKWKRNLSLFLQWSRVVPALSRSVCTNQLLKSNLI